VRRSTRCSRNWVDGDVVVASTPRPTRLTFCPSREARAGGAASPTDARRLFLTAMMYLAVVSRLDPPCRAVMDWLDAGFAMSNHWRQRGSQRIMDQGAVKAASNRRALPGRRSSDQGPSGVHDIRTGTSPHPGRLGIPDSIR